MKRNKHSLSHYVLSTFDMGELVPIGNFEVLPGDSVRMSSSALLRVSPLMTPVMHPVAVRIHHWFVPYRILWDEWEDFITGGPDGTGSSVPPPTFAGNVCSVAGQLGDYFGVPTGTPASVLVSRFAWNAYNMIFNEFYRDQDLQTPVNDASFVVQNVAWEKDYFTSARPWTQKGADVTMPISGSAPVRTNPTALISGGGQNPTLLMQINGTPPTNNLQLSTGVGSMVQAGGAGTAAGSLVFSNLYADLAQATSSTVNDVRLAFALQRYQEARAQYGSRYTEYLRYLGVRSSDARLQRPEYLGGGRATISFSEVLRTGNNEEAATPEAIGEMKGHGISALRTRSFVRFFEEHGIVLSLASVRPRSMYTNGLHRRFSRQTKEDFWQKELELVGQQEVLNKEVYTAHTTPEGVFGYQDRYADYRHMPSHVSGDFRSTMSDWHLARIFASDPALNSSFVQCVPSKRVHAVQTEDVIWGMFSHSIQARRLVGHRTIGRII